jgi:crotonobetainyl-CoA:carnitine CoA-transferase CaiB-like acyl-CoA transferase
MHAQPWRAGVRNERNPSIATVREITRCPLWSIGGLWQSGIVAAVDEALTALGVDHGRVSVTGEPQPAALDSPLAVAECAVAAVTACLSAAADLTHARTGRGPDVEVDTGHVAAAVRSETWLRDPLGHPVASFAPLSRLWPAADGWTRTHGNYPWHRSALLAALGVSKDDEVGPAIAEREALEVERAVYAAGGLAVAARTRDQWPTTQTPLVEWSTVDGPTRELTEAGPLPAEGIRVLDLTRVIAGPVGTRMLGAFGADVLRVDPPERPEPPWQAVEGVLGKRSTNFDAGTADGLERLHDLLDNADVLVTGYRPGALRRLGLDPDQMAQRHPGTIVVTLSAWGTTGEWGQRRGFDSLVQIATGIGWAVSADGQKPGVLPCQLLDHATGYLVAASTLAALARRARTGATSHVRLSLARTAQWLLDQPAPQSVPRTTDAQPYRVEFGNGWTGISPPGRIDGRALSWPHLPPAYGQASADWL